MSVSIGAIILAAGRGSRLNSRTINKVALPFQGKPIIEYAVDVMEDVADPVVVVVGAFAESVKDALKHHPKLIYVHQKEQLGTGHATQVGLAPLVAHPPALVLVGYGDHMMFYRNETVQKLIKLHAKKRATVSLITVRHAKPTELAWGRIIRDAKGNIIKSVEQKDANDDELAADELNAGFYVFDYEFLKNHIDKIPVSEATGEYYLNALVEIALSEGKTVAGMEVPFEEVGIGVNRAEELEASQRLHQTVRTVRSTL